jgi:hypothetical protein
MKLPLSYMLPALDGSSAERAAVLQEIRDRGIVETDDLVALCFKVEALLDHAEHQEATEIRLRKELADRETETAQDLIEVVESVFDDLRELLPKHADLIYTKCNEILGRIRR